MSKLALDLILDEYRAQRKYRESKRNEYLRRFEVLKQNFAHIHRHYPSHIDNEAHLRHAPQPEHSHPHPHPHPQQQIVVIEVPTERHHHHSHEHQQHHQHAHSHRNEENLQNRLEAEEFALMQENEELKKNLVNIETQERDRLQNFKSEIETVRNKYLEEIKKLTEAAKASKEQVQAKTHKVKLQSEAAHQKNLEIEQTNKTLKAQIGEGNALMGQYATQIKREYSQKIGEFEKIFNSSNEKIQAMEKEFNEDEFIENTLKNEELLKSIEENAEKAEEAGKILEDYGTLLEGKKEILTEINSNIQMKEKEIEKMAELEGKMKLIMDKLSSEKKIYVSENNKMAQELLEIKNLLVGVMNESK